MANGEEQRRAAGRLIQMQNLERQNADRATGEIPALSRDEELADTGLTEETRGSVLDTGREAPSYAFKEAPPPEPIAGGGMIESPAMELERQRASEERMRRTQASLVGPERAGEAPEEAGPRATGREETERGGPPTEAEEPEEALSPEAARFAALRRAPEEERRERAAKFQAIQNAERAKKEVRERMLNYLKAADGGLSVETLAITLFVNLIIWTVQAINTFIFKNELIPEESFVEDVCCVGCWLGLCVNWLISPPCFIGPLIILIYAIVHYAKDSVLGKLFLGLVGS